MRQGAHYYQQAFLQVVAQLVSASTTAECLKTVVRHVGHALKAHRCSILSRKGRNRFAKIVAIHEDQALIGYPIDLRRYPEILGTLNSGLEYSITDLASLPPRVLSPHSTESYFVLVLPILFDSRRNRVFILRASRRHVGFRPEEVEFCRSIIACCRRMLPVIQQQCRTEARLAHAESARRQALLQNHKKNRILRVLAHELKNPLCIVNGYLNMLLDPSTGPVTQEQLEILEDSRQMCEIVLGILNSAINLTFMEEGELTYEFRTEAIPPLLDRLLAGFGKEAQRRQISILRQIPDNLPPVRLDRDKISFAFTNLIHNAMRYTQAGGRITIQARVADRPSQSSHTKGFVDVSVADTGPGVDPEKVPHLFESKPTQKLYRSFQEGLGVGLPLSREIVQQHGGSISLDQTYIGGARFIISLPLAAEESTDGLHTHCG